MSTGDAFYSALVDCQRTLGQTATLAILRVLLRRDTDIETLTRCLRVAVQGKSPESDPLLQFAQQSDAELAA
jgi:hypothetical protein